MKSTESPLRGDVTCARWTERKDTPSVRKRKEKGSGTKEEKQEKQMRIYEREERRKGGEMKESK